jgi:hypothetical protein
MIADAGIICRTILAPGRDGSCRRRWRATRRNGGGGERKQRVVTARQGVRPRARIVLRGAAAWICSGHGEITGTLAEPHILRRRSAIPASDRTVVLLALHSDGGALGFVGIANRRVDEALGELLALAGYGDEGACNAFRWRVGGPVQPSSGVILCLDPSLAADDNGASSRWAIGSAPPRHGLAFHAPRATPRRR